MGDQPASAAATAARPPRDPGGTQPSGDPMLLEATAPVQGQHQPRELELEIQSRINAVSQVFRSLKTPPLPLPQPQPPAPAPAPAPSAPPCLQHHSEVCPWSHHGLHEPLGRVRLAKMGTQLRHLLGAPASAAAAANTDATAHHTRYELSLQIPERLLMMMMMMKAYTIIIEVVKGLLLLLLVVVKGQSIACFS